MPDDPAARKLPVFGLRVDPGPGQLAIVGRDGHGIPAVPNGTAWEKYMQGVVVNEPATWQRMVRAKQVTELENGTLVRGEGRPYQRPSTPSGGSYFDYVTAPKDLRNYPIEVKVMNGPHEGKTFWIIEAHAGEGIVTITPQHVAEKAAKQQRKAARRRGTK
jgi:hypothetical protein